jgi:hypothetical protein
MSSTISGNVGGSSFSGAQVQCVSVPQGVITLTTADASGNYSFAGLVAGNYQISATIANFVYYHPVQVIVDGVSTYSNINLNPTALNASNTPPQTSNF